MYEDQVYQDFFDHTREIYWMIESKHEECKMNKTEPKQFWMITGDGNAPKVRHYNKQDAMREATRLAETNPGKEFFVMQSVDMLTQPSGVVRHRF